MTNQQRVEQSSTLRNILMNLRSDAFIKQLTIQNISRRPYSDENNQLLTDLQNELNILNGKIAPLNAELLSLSRKYFVEYEGEVYRDGVKKLSRKNEVIWVGVEVEVDNDFNKFDLSNADLNLLAKELHNHIYYTQFTNFAITDIKNAK